MSKAVRWAVYMAALVAFVWLLWSWCDVLAHQNCGGTQNGMNLFLMMIRR